MAWGMVRVEERRMEFVVEASRGEWSLRELCEKYEISRPTGYVWLRRYQAGGIAAMQEKSRRPRRNPAKTADAIEERVVELRQKRPDWGARKLHVLLGREGIELPVITVHRILLRHGLVRVEDRHRAATKRFERSAPNELWQMDFKSPVGWNASVGPLSLLDDHSRYAIALKGTWTTGAEAVKQGLIEAFEASGMPEALLMDHGTPWWNMKSAAGWTWLTVWLMKLGIRLHLSGYRHPETQGKVERFHRSLERAARRRGYPSADRRQVWLDAFRQEYNHERPHEALGMKTPAQVWRPSGRHYRATPVEWEYETGVEVKRLTARGRLNFQGRSWEISRALAGERVALVRIEQRVLVYYCRSVVRELDLGTQRSAMAERWAPLPPKCKGSPDNTL